MGMFAGVYHWFPSMYGRLMNKKLGYIHVWLTIISAYGVFFPMHFMGLAGVPRRYYSNEAIELFSGFSDMNISITWFAILAAIAQGIFIFNFFFSIYKGKKAPQNPWGSNTLEWTAPVGDIHGNWPGKIPEVHRWPYDYSKPGKKEDFVVQTVPLEEGEKDGGH